jgi:sec-independent protein translocase protein TatB
MFEMLLLLIVGLVVLGPERLPEAARLIGAWISKTKRTFIDIRTGVEHEVKAHELRTRIKGELEKAGLNDIQEKLTEQESLLREELLHGKRPPRKTPQQHTPAPEYPEIPEGHDPIASAPEPAPVASEPVTSVPQTAEQPTSDHKTEQGHKPHE